MSSWRQELIYSSLPKRWLLMTWHCKGSGYQPGFDPLSITCMRIKRHSVLVPRAVLFSNFCALCKDMHDLSCTVYIRWQRQPRQPFHNEHLIIITFSQSLDKKRIACLHIVLHLYGWRQHFAINCLIVCNILPYCISFIKIIHWSRRN